MMTLDEAIRHYEENTECTEEFRQLAEWLQLLQGYENDQVLYHKKAITKMQVAYNVAYRKALRILDEMFMDNATISADDWFRDSPNLFQGRETFIKRMEDKI